MYYLIINAHFYEKRYGAFAAEKGRIRQVLESCPCSIHAWLAGCAAGWRALGGKRGILRCCEETGPELRTSLCLIGERGAPFHILVSDRCSMPTPG